MEKATGVSTVRVATLSLWARRLLCRLNGIRRDSDAKISARTMAPTVATTKPIRPARF
jgi:hypothetical protein